MTEKRFISNYDGSEIIDRKGSIAYAFHSGAERPVIELLNRLNDENEQLKQELKIYRKIANCSNCHHHDYDWFDDGDEFEVCEKGNDISDRICEDWRKF